MLGKIQLGVRALMRYRKCYALYPHALGEEQGLTTHDLLVALLSDHMLLAKKVSRILLNLNNQPTSM
jgi:hypothetical protein